MTLQDIVAKLSVLKEGFFTSIAAVATEQEIRHLQALFLGKKGSASHLLREMAKLPKEDKPKLGAAFNQTKTEIEAEVSRRLLVIAEEKAAKELATVIDVTIPSRKGEVGHAHLLSQVQSECIDIFRELGFCVADGPQIDTDFRCFEALAIPKNHPARDMQDTFYITEDVVLRPHTSPVQIRTMQSQKPPVKIVAPGIVYRRDDDPTHSPMFMQIEGLVVDEGVRFSDLKGVLLHFVTRFFGKRLPIRLRPSYFPFVEPGAEVDMQCSFCQGAKCRLCKHTGWIEIGGAGMVDPEVFDKVGYDSEKLTGFAFGMGIERMAMLRHNVTDIKYYYDGNLQFLRQF